MSPSHADMPRLVIANRGEIARRILRAARARGWLVAVVSVADDADAPVRLEADAVLEVGSFLSIPEIVAASKAWGARYLHPGYGFLSENADFAAAVEAAGIVFVGPTPENMRALGGKESAKAFASRLGVPTLDALLSHELASLPEAKWKGVLDARGIVAPYLVKASGGGGGKGMRVVERFEELAQAIHRASQEALAGFGDATVFVERYLARPRHVEVQVFGDGAGGGVFLGERECSLQRRHQKVIEEAPSPVVGPELRARVGASALSLVKETKYRGAGTVEFLLTESGEYYFLEMNTRLQVEHPVTELVYGVDLVQAQLTLAEGRFPAELGRPDEFRVPEPRGVALEARILAEDPRNGFLPTPGTLLRYREPSGPGVRVDSGVEEGGRVNASFDSMISKLIVHGADRAEAAARLHAALGAYVVHGCTTNIPFLRAIAAHPDFGAGRESTAWIGEHLDSLNANRVPAPIVTLLARKDVREALADALGGGAVASRGACGLLSAGALFARGAHGPASDSRRPRRGVWVEKGTVPGDLLLGGETIGEALAGLTSEERGSAAPEIARAASRAAFVAKRGGPAALAGEAWLPLTVTRVSVDHLAVGVFGEILEVACPRWERFEAEGAAAHLPDLRAPMAGKVLEVLVGKGTRLAEGAVAFVVESMKMQLEIRATVECVVEEVLVEKGQVLAGPEVLATLSAGAPRD